MHKSSCADSALPPRRWRNWLFRLGVLAFLLWPAWNIVAFLFFGNLHEIIPGKLYRGAQPSPQALEKLIHKHKIRTVLNVRGCCFPDPWYVGEAEVCQRLGVYLEDVTFSAVHFPSRDELRLLVEILDRAEYPIFLHCRHGADRTGMTAMIAQLLLEEHSYESAHHQLGLRYGHAPIGRTTLLDRFVQLYDDWLTANNQEHSPKRFRHWLLNEYRGGCCDAHFEKVERLFAEPRLGQPLPYRVTIHNTSNGAWQFRPLKTAGFHLGFRVISQGQEVIHEGRAGMADTLVQAGEKIQVMMIIPPIQTKGEYRLMVDMVEEGHCWFHQTGSEPWQEEIVIRE